MRTITKILEDLFFYLECKLTKSLLEEKKRAKVRKNGGNYRLLYNRNSNDNFKLEEK